MSSVCRISLVVAVLALSLPAYSQTVGWTYLEGGWGRVDPDGGSAENGWFGGVSVALGKLPLHVFGEYGNFDPLDNWQAGGGWHGLLGKKADLFADAAYYDADVDDGFKVRFGVRWMIVDWFELNGNLQWTDLDIRDNRGAAVNVVFGLGKWFSLGTGGEWGDEVDTYRAFARFYLGRRD